MKLEQPRNPNYAATVVQLKDFVQLEGCDRIQAALIFGNHVIVGKDAQAGDVGLFFPVETQLDEEFLYNNNLFRKTERNKDTAAKGFFEDHGRIKCVKFRGHKSEGFFIPTSSLLYISAGDLSYGVGDTFDKLGDHEICRKYIPRRNPGRLNTQQVRVAKLKDKIVDNQFRFHPDTENLRRNVHKIHPGDYISISDKWHGTSVVISKVLTLRKLKWYERALKAIGVAIQEQEYGLVYSSRKVIKAVNGLTKHNNHFYDADIWGVVAKEVEDKIPVGFTLYGEIVGYTPTGSPIQGGYHYGCPVGGHKFLVYRVTCTNATGQVVELTWSQMFDFTKKYGLEMVKEIWYGRAMQFLNPDNYKSTEDWQEMFLKQLEGVYVNDGLCEYNNNEVPAEGVVVRIDGLEECQAFKLKNFRFLEAESKSLDKGEVDLETAESAEVEEAA